MDNDDTPQQINYWQDSNTLFNTNNLHQDDVPNWQYPQTNNVTELKPVNIDEGKYKVSRPLKPVADPYKDNSNAIPITIKIKVIVSIEVEEQ